MNSDFGSYLIRSLLSEGRLLYEFVEKTKSGIRARLIDKPGPTGLITTTTAPKLHPENETRLLSLGVIDTPEQTKAVMRALAADDAASTINYSPWHALQAWLAAGEHQVDVPFARKLADLIPPIAVRLRRDFKLLLTLIRAHALLHRATRGHDNQGRIRPRKTTPLSLSSRSLYYPPIRTSTPQHPPSAPPPSMTPVPSPTAWDAPRRPTATALHRFATTAGHRGT